MQQQNFYPGVVSKSLGPYPECAGRSLNGYHPDTGNLHTCITIVEIFTYLFGAICRRIGGDVWGVGAGNDQ